MDKTYKAILIKEKLHRKLKVKTSKEGKGINEVVENLIEKYLNEKN